MAVDVGDSIFLLFIFLFSTLIFFIFHLSKKKPARSPRSPLALPILGHFHLLSSALPKSLEALARRYGPLMQISIGSSRFLVASDADTAQQILRANDVEFASKFVFAPSHHNIFKEAEFVNAPYGTYWKFMKRLCMTKLFAGPQLDRFYHIREDETMKRDGEDTMMCGARLSFAEVHGPLKHVDLFGNGKRLRTALRRFDALIEQIIKEYEDDCGEASEEKDVMDILLETYRDPNAEIRLTRDQIKHFFLDLLIAGVDTTSASMQWAIIELLKHPHKLKKLRRRLTRR
ncbi:3,9-dihydroxypterocarpan 6A-monooxygenase-like [Eucalyptus grandis]|uniref:3,9-dihydroxypterocarpan 6A-monooxygenase-like n=1 Tax=Eucalyptus grandis TaxID=71139 RepID=UPI00192EFCE0|nr:3,9-dihydroxypterocarpan 6A-monooxygenase-like [Eucalyptus grandis]